MDLDQWLSTLGVYQVTRGDFFKQKCPSPTFSDADLLILGGPKAMVIFQELILMCSQGWEPLA